MTHRAYRDDLDHAWVRSGLVDPPPFGESLPDEWLETEFNFYRRVGVANDIGGFAGTGSPVNYLTIHGHVDLQVDSGLLNSMEIGPFVRRHYEIIIPVPDDTASLPVKGDRVWWIGPLGQRLDQPLRSVDLPEGIRDHVEIQTEEFE